MCTANDDDDNSQNIKKAETAVATRTMTAGAVLATGWLEVLVSGKTQLRAHG